MIIKDIHCSQTISVRRLARTFQEPVSTVGRWIRPEHKMPLKKKLCPVSGNLTVREKIRHLCEQPRHLTFGYRRIWALLRREGMMMNKKTVWRIMHEMHLTRPKIWHKPYRPKRIEKMKPVHPNQNWQIDMTSFALSDLTALYLVMVTDCYSRKIVGWTLDRRCRAGEWIGALRMALESEGLMTKEACKRLTLRSDNGSQPCSKKFVEYLGQTGVRGQYTGYNAPDDNAYIERVIRTVKEEEIWLNMYDTVCEAGVAIEAYVDYYNQERIHSALGYRTPNEIAAAYNTLAAA
jgi:putative transposase